MSDAYDKLAGLTRAIARGEVSTASRFFQDAARTKPARPILKEPVTIEQACPGEVQQQATAMGQVSYHHIERPLSEVSSDLAFVSQEYAAVMRGARQLFDELEASRELCIASECQPEQLLFMDTETCGFSGSCIFLVGVMRYEPAIGELVFRQYFARHYGEEPAILARFADDLAASELLVTFNGKSFDMPMVRDRLIVHAQPLEQEPPHLDLVHACRRRWKKSLPNCRLQTLEQHLLGRLRTGDIPSAAIPDAYHQFVATGDARTIADALHHNLLDLLTMAQLVVSLLTGAIVDP